MWSVRILCAMLLGTLATGAVVQADGDVAQHVHIQDISFQPAIKRIFIGDTVTWDNHDGVQHTVSSDAGEPMTFNQQMLPGGAPFTLSFPNVLSVSYHCNIHGQMLGTIEVYDPNTLPDLQVSAVETAFDVPGFLRDFEVEILNDGPGPSSPVTVRLDFESPEGKIRRVGVYTAPALASGASYSDTIRWGTVGKIGDFDLIATVDYSDAAFELDEGDNVATSVTSLLVPGLPAQDLRDPPGDMNPPSALRRFFE